MLDLMKASTLAETGGKLICFYGHGGVGKTTTSISNPNCPKQLIVQLEDDGGLVAVSKINQQIAQNIDAVRLNFNGRGAPCGYMATVIQELIQIAGNYQFIIFDPFTNLRNRHASWLRTAEGTENITQKQWGLTKLSMDAIFDLILELKQYTNVIINAHEDVRKVDDKITGNSSYMIEPAIGGSTNMKLEQYADEIIRISLNENNRTFDCGSSPNVMTKSRKFGSLQPSEKLFNDLNITNLF